MSELESILLLHPSDMVQPMSPPPTTFTIFTNASDLAWKVTSVTQKAMGFFDAEESQLHITWKELSAVSKAIESQDASF
jgi:hypothetical protein